MTGGFLRCGCCDKLFREVTELGVEFPSAKEMKEKTRRQLKPRNHESWHNSYNC
jgi:hypothetical protein